MLKISEHLHVSLSESSTFDFGFDLGHSLRKLLFKVEGLESLLIVVDAG